MNLKDRIDRTEAGNILGVNGRTAARFVDYGLIASVKNGHKVTFSKEDVELLKIKLDIRNALTDNIKEISVLSSVGCPVSGMIDRFNLKNICPKYDIPAETKLQYALDIYSVQRDRRAFAKYDVPLNVRPTLLLPGEVTARLKLVDGHVVRDLIIGGDLDVHEQKYIGKDGLEKQKDFVFIDSLRMFLGEHYCSSPLYKSDEAAKINKVSIEHIDRIANDQHKGLKLKRSKQGIYLFSMKDIQEMNKFKVVVYNGRTKVFPK